MPKRPLIIAGILSGLAVSTLIFLSLYRGSRELEETRNTLAETRQTVEKSESAAAVLKEQLAQSQARVKALEEEMRREKEAAVQTQHSLEQEMRNAIQSKDVTISQLQGKLTVNILDRVMFDSGEAELRTDGQSVLQQVAGVLAQHPGLKIHVIGHTDNVPIRAGSKGRFISNWELSTGRAAAAVHFLTEKAGVDPRRVGIVGYGEHRPVADNATAEGRAKNRRIAITILPDELAGADVSPGARPAQLPAAITNAPPAAESAP